MVILLIQMPIRSLKQIFLYHLVCLIGNTFNFLKRWTAVASPVAQAMSFQRILAFVHKQNAILYVNYREVTQSLGYTIHNNNLSLL